MTGLDLRLARTAARVKGQDLAFVMGVTPARVSQIERQEQVAPGMAERYQRALAALAAPTTEGVT